MDLLDLPECKSLVIVVFPLSPFVLCSSSPSLASDPYRSELWSNIMEMESSGREWSYANIRAPSIRAPSSELRAFELHQLILVLTDIHQPDRDQITEQHSSSDRECYTLVG